MIKNYIPAYYETITEYDIVFDIDEFSGFSFPCDKEGNLLSSVPKEAKENYKNCLEHPEKFKRFNKIVQTERRVRNNSRGTCRCGNEIELYDMYYGTCQCEKCGQWYNLFGQEILPPNEWEENLENDY